MSKQYAKKGDSGIYQTKRCRVLAVSEGVARIKVNNEEKIVPLGKITNVKQHYSVKGVIK